MKRCCLAVIAVVASVALAWSAEQKRPSDRDQQYQATPDFEEKNALAAFDKVWNAFDREYAMFAIKPKVDWNALRETYRPRAAAAQSNHALAAVLCEMLNHLEDLHVYIQVDGQTIPGYRRDRPLNANPQALNSLIGSITRTDHDLVWGRTSDGIAYINIDKLSDDELPRTFDDVLDKLKDPSGLIIDLRYNGGGSEPLGCEITGRLLDQPRVYSQSQFRNGPKHNDLTPKYARKCKPAGPWRYKGPVVALQGQKTMSSAESFALALAQCPQVTTLGDRTAGSSGNPRRVEAGYGIVVNLPRWIDMDPDGKPIDVVGVLPKVPIDAMPEAFCGESDPVLAAALENLRQRIKEEPLPPGGVLQRRDDTPLSKDRPNVISVSPADGASNVDPITEIRIRFDRPMDPNRLGLYLPPNSQMSIFRLRGSPQYHSDTREFVLPVVLSSASSYTFSLHRSPQGVADFRSIDGAAPAAYSFQFTTRKATVDSTASPPRVVSVDPPSDAKVGMLTAIRVRFDRPMQPDAFELMAPIDYNNPKEQVFVPFPVEYDAASRGFTFHTWLPPSTTWQIELKGFRGADGGQAEPVWIEYRVYEEPFLREQRAKIVAAGHSAKLYEVIDAIRRRRLTLKSLEETVRTVSLGGSRGSWFNSLEINNGRFSFQGDRQFYADITPIMDIPLPQSPSPMRPFRIGSNGRECWFHHGELKTDRSEVTFCSVNDMQQQMVAICDPFGANRFSSTEEAIHAMNLEYRGLVTLDGKDCHRIRSWIAPEMVFEAIDDWLIDAETLLPVVCEDHRCGHASRYEFLYSRVNEPIAQEVFQAPKDADIEGTPNELKVDYDYFFLKVCDGSDGQMSVHWGQRGRFGVCSSGLN